MKFFAIVFFVVFVNPNLQAQSSETYTELVSLIQPNSSTLKLQQTININEVTGRVQDKSSSVEYRFLPKKLAFTSITPFLSFSCGWNEVNDEANNSTISIRFSIDKTNWSDWTTIKTDEHYEKTNYSFVSQLMEFDKGFVYYELKISSNLKKQGNSLQQLFLNFFSPGNVNSTPARMNNAATNNNRTSACELAQPVFVNRAGWNCPQTSWGVGTTTVTHLIVHHAAGTNSSSDWGAVVLAIWNQHTGTNGYSDIGYNWLIAPDGVLYEGRYKSSTDNVTGAHFCGTNGGTMGVCMLGDYTNITITSAARTKLVSLLGWKACERNLDALGNAFHASSNLTLNNISGHRDGCATQCPGNTFYPDLPGVRIDVSNIMNGATPVSSINGLEEFSIGPNPVGNTAIMTLKLNTVKEVEYRILTADGKLLYQSSRQKLTGYVREELSMIKGITPGVYIVQLWVNNEMISRKLIKQ